MLEKELTELERSMKMEMETMRWHKLNTNRLYSLMVPHPNKIVGMWLKVWCQLSMNKTRWSKAATLKDWARIIGERPAETKKFINYIIDNFVDVTIITIRGEKVTDEMLFSITDIFQQREDEKTTLSKKKDKRFNTESELTLARKDLKTKLLKAYHPAKIGLQAALFRNEFGRVLLDSSRGLKTEDKIKIEKRKVDEILEYIKYYKTTRAWIEDEGLYVYGVGKFMQQRPWENDIGWQERHEKYKKEASSKENQKSGQELTAKDFIVKQLEGESC
jgi:hypothetical protein